MLLALAFGPRFSAISTAATAATATAAAAFFGLLLGWCDSCRRTVDGHGGICMGHVLRCRRLLCYLFALWTTFVPLLFPPFATTATLRILSTSLSGFAFRSFAALIAPAWPTLAAFTTFAAARCIAFTALRSATTTTLAIA